MNRTKAFQIIIVILGAFFLGYFAGTTKINFDWKNYKPVLQVSGKEPPASLSHVDFTHFWQAWDNVSKNYYDKTKLDPNKMVTGAINGMLGTLDDPYTLYLPPTTNEEFKEGLAGEFQGIGAELGLKDGAIIVVSPLSDSPAIRAGLRPEDKILKVNDEDTAGWTIAQAVEKIRGPKGTEVILNVVHKDSKDSQDIRITRDVIHIKSIEGEVSKIKDIDNITLTNILKSNENDEVMYLKLRQFGDNTNKEWLALMNDLNLRTQSNSNFKGVILDLRNNPGGYLADAVFVSSEFLRQGQTVVIQEETGGNRTTLKADRRGLFTNTPLIVLINKGSASASEIVSGALSDHNRATLVGETSFGKGTIQEAQDLGQGAGIHITIAKWLTPNGIWVNGSGLKPDIEIALDEDSPERDTQLEKALEELVR